MTERQPQDQLFGRRVKVNRWIVALIALVLAARFGLVGGAQIIDRVLAVVANEPITLSDVTAAMRLGFAPAPAAATDPVQAALNTLIERQLQLIEVNRFVPAEPRDADVEARLAAVTARFKTPAALDATLTETGVTRDQLRAMIRDDLRIETYLQQRFGAAYQPAEDEIVRYYRTHETEYTRNGVLRPYSEVRDQVRQRLIDERTASLIRDWITGLRRRVDITILPR